MVAAPETVAPATNGASHSPKPVNGTESAPSTSSAPLMNGHSEHAHDDGKAKEANLPPPEIARQIPCRFFPLGTCKYGEQCAFSHSIPIVPANGSMSMPGQNGRGGPATDFSSQPMQHPGMMMYYPQQYDNGEYAGYPSQFSPPQGFYYPPQFAPYYAPPQPFYPPSAQASTSPNAAQAEQSSLQSPPAAAQGGENTKAESVEASSALPVEASQSTSPANDESNAEAAAAQGANVEAASPTTSSHQADATAGPSVVPALPAAVPSFFQPAPMNVPYYPVNGRQPNSRMRNMNGSFNGGNKRFLAPDGTKLPKPTCSFFEANRCRNRDECSFPHRLADGTDARKLGLGMIGIDGRTEGPEKEGGMPPAWQQSKRQSGPRTNNNAPTNKEGRPQRARQEDGGANAQTSTSAGRRQNQANGPSGDSRISLGRLPPGSSAPSLVAAINGLTRRIPPISNQQVQHQPQQRVPSGDDFPALAATDKSTTGHATPARQVTRPSSPEPATQTTPAKEPWSPEIGRDGAPSTEPSPPQSSEKKASSESGDSDFIIVTANDGQSNENAGAAQSPVAPSPVEKAVPAAAAPAHAPKISFASAAAKGASVPAPIRPASKPRAPAAAAGKDTTKTSNASSPSSATPSHSGRSHQSKTSTQATSPVATSAAVSPTQHQQQQAAAPEEDDEGFTVAVRKERRDHRKNASQSTRA